MEDELRNKIEKYMREHNLCTFAISDGNTPYAHTMYYVCDGLRIYFETAPHSQKVHILQSNQKIALTIDEDYPEWTKVQGLEIMGKAVLKEKKDNENIEKRFLEKFPHLNDLGGIPDHHVFIEIIPEKIYFIDFTKKSGEKQVYYIEEKKMGLKW